VDTTLVFLEIKTRSSNIYGYPEEAVGHAKKHRIACAVRAYFLNNRISRDAYIRFDVIAVSCDSRGETRIAAHIENIEFGEEIF
jgi:putative endonuclease